MLRIVFSAALLLASFSAQGQVSDDNANDEEQSAAEQPTKENATEQREDSTETTKTMSGMSILGNEEAPKSLVIIPWKSSELGDDISLTDTLDDRAQPVDKEVFLRALNFYDIRSAELPMPTTQQAGSGLP